MTAGQRDASRDHGGFRIGVDLGGTKIEVLAIDREGRERHRQRVPTPQGDYEATIDAITATLESRDPYTAGHQRRVAHLAAAIAQEMGLAQERIDGLRFGALIHDIGKIRVPGELLCKPTL